MTIEQLQKMIARGPFSRSIFISHDGRVLPVNHPEFLAVPAPGRPSGVGCTDGTIEIVDLLLVTQSEAATKRRGASRAVAAAIVGSRYDPPPFIARNISRTMTWPPGQTSTTKNAGEDEEHQREDQLHGCLRGFFFRDLPGGGRASRSLWHAQGLGDRRDQLVGLNGDRGERFEVIDGPLRMPSSLQHLVLGPAHLKAASWRDELIGDRAFDFLISSATLRIA